MINPTHGADNIAKIPPSVKRTFDLQLNQPYQEPLVHKYLGWKTIPGNHHCKIIANHNSDGEVAAVHDSYGNVKLVKGPRSYLMLNEKAALVV